MPTIQEQMKVDLIHNSGDFQSSESGDLKRITGLENLKQALYHRLITVKGTLVHRPNYGIGIQQWQGQIANLDKQRNLALIIRDQFLEDSRVEKVNQVKFETSNIYPDQFKIFVKYTAVGYNETGSEFDPFNLGD